MKKKKKKYGNISGIAKAKTLQDELFENKDRLSLSLIISALVFVSFLAAIVLAALVLVLFYSDVIPGLSLIREGRPFRYFFILAAFSLIVGTLTSFLVGRFPLRPINRVINGMKRLTQGDFKVRIKADRLANRVPSLKEMTESFNKMAQELEGTEMLRSDFINNFSHEFKTPIVSIAGFASLLRQGGLSEEEQQEYLEIIETESKRLSSMATNVLNMSRVEKQTILTDVTTYNLSEQLRNSVLMLESKWDPKNLDLDLEFEECMVTGNEELLKQVWVNLLDNAVKFTPDGGTVRIRIKDSDDSIAVSISNTGSEIPPEKQDRIFRKFYQADESHTSEGNGIGLSIVKYVTELHKGTVEVDSRNMVTTFTVTLPVYGKQ